MHSCSHFYQSRSYQPKRCHSGNTKSNFYVYRTLCVTSSIAQHCIHEISSATPLQTRQVYCFSPIFGKHVRRWDNVSNFLKVLELVFQKVPHEALMSTLWEYDPEGLTYCHIMISDNCSGKRIEHTSSKWGEQPNKHPCRFIFQ